MVNRLLRHLRFNLRAAIVLVVFIAMLLAIVNQSRRIKNLQGQLRKLHASLESPVATARAVSFIEVGEAKESGHVYINKVLMAADGRKRVEHLTSKSGTISIFDDWGIHRLILQPSTKAVTVFEAVETFGEGSDLNDWLNSFQQVSADPEEALGRREINGKTAKGFRSKKNGASCTVWVSDATGELLQAARDDSRIDLQMYDIQYHDSFDEAMFSFDVPEEYNVVEHHPAK